MSNKTEFFNGGLKTTVMHKFYSTQSKCLPFTDEQDFFFASALNSFNIDT